MQPDVELSYAEEDIAKAVAFLNRFDEVAALSDIASSADYLRSIGAARLGIVGFCLGGKLAPISVARGAGDVAVGFYGVGLDQHAETLASMRQAVQLHFGDQDDHMPAEAVAALERAAARNPELEVFRYPEAGHAFFRSDLRDEVSRDAHGRMMKLLNASLLSQEAGANSVRGAQ
jgi:carboxymethylenebutenolidase